MNDVVSRHTMTDVTEGRRDREGKRLWKKPRIKTLRVIQTRVGTAAGPDEDLYVNDNPDNKYMPIS